MADFWDCAARDSEALETDSGNDAIFVMRPSSKEMVTHGLDVDRKSIHLAIHDMKGLLTHCQATQVAADVNVVADVGKRDSLWPDNRFW